MTWWLWLIAALIGAALFALGMVAARIWHSRAEGFDHGDRVSATLGIVFTVVALAVVADTVNLQVRFNRQVASNTRINQDQTLCTQEVLRVLAARSDERVKVDHAAQRLDILVEDAIDVYVAGGTPDWPAVRQALADTAAARNEAARVYIASPVPRC